MTGAVGDRLLVLKQRLDRLRTLNPESLDALTAWYDVELTYGSNAIEGGTLTRRDTSVALEKRLSIGEKPLKDRLEAIGHRDALRFVRALVATGEKVQESDIRELHRLIAVRTDPAQAGRYNWDPRESAGASIAPPMPSEIPALMGEFTGWLATAPPGPETAFAAHARLIAITPFVGGNGRVARLVMNLVLMRAGFPPVVIGPEHRAAYIDALQALQLRGDPQPYQRFMTERLEASLEHRLAMLERVTPPCAG